MERWQNKVAVVTGGSSGISAGILKELVAAGLIVIGLARRQHLIEEHKNEMIEEQQKRLHSYKCDVTSLKLVNEAFDWIEKEFGGIDVLVSAAGTLNQGQLTSLEPQLIQEVLQTNIMGMVYCTQRAFKSMRERNVNGHVILINSIEGHKVQIYPRGPQGNIYTPTKFAITAIAEIYRQEFKGFETKVKVTSLSPGLVATKIIPDHIQAAVGSAILQPKDVGQAVLYVLGTPPHVLISELTIKAVGEKF